MFFPLSLSWDCCLVKSYAAPIYGKELQGHVFKTLQLEKEQLCRINCYLEKTCQSYNLASSPHLGRWECELSNTDDKQHPESLVSSPGKIYRATQVTCVISRTRRFGRVYDIFSRACAEIKICSFCTRKWATSLGSLGFFSAFPFSPFVIFLRQWLTFYWASLQFLPWSS